MFYQVPFGYHDQDEIVRTLEQAGFRNVRCEVVSKIGRARGADDAATGLVQGTPVATQILERDPSLLPIITQRVSDAIKNRFGEAEIHSPMQAIIAQGWS